MDLFSGLCAGMTYAEGAVVVSSALSTLRIQKKRTEDLLKRDVPVTCLNCTTNHTAFVGNNFGQLWW